VRAAELGEFLRSRRLRVDPATVGYPTVGRRRTPGLRREELAALSGVTVSWLTKLEQGRARSVSPGVLDSLSRTLRLDGAEHAHLFALAGLRADREGHADREGGDAPTAPGMTPALRALLDALEPNPAYVLDRRWDLVGWNAAEEALFAPLARVGTEHPNLLELTFTDPDLTRLMADHEAELRRLVAQFRIHLTEWSGDPALAGLVAHLEARSPRFAAMWATRDVAPFASTRREFDHPSAGRLVFDHQRFAVLDQPGAQLVVYTSAPGTDSAARLRSTSSSPS
jgi:transcriptional regulator with XRE-family HTH domain